MPQAADGTPHAIWSSWVRRFSGTATVDSLYKAWKPTDTLVRTGIVYLKQISRTLLEYDSSQSVVQRALGVL